VFKQEDKLIPYMPPGSVVSTDNGVPVIAGHKADIEKWLRNNTFFERLNQKWNITPLETTKTQFMILIKICRKNIFRTTVRSL